MLFISHGFIFQNRDCENKLSVMTVRYILPSLLLALFSPFLMANECVRMEPIAELSNSPQIANYAFARKSGQEAIERFTLPSGVPATIEHSGCAHFVLKLEFHVPSKGHNIQNTKYWLQTAESVVAELNVIKSSSHFTAILAGIKKAQSLGNYAYKSGVETIEGYEYTYIEAIKKSKAQVALILTYEVLL